MSSEELAGQPVESVADTLVAHRLLTASQWRMLQGMTDLLVEGWDGDAEAALNTLCSRPHDARLRVLDGRIEFSTGLSSDSLVEELGRVSLEHPGRYTIGEEHGRGGQSRVLVAFDEHIGRQVALKELLQANANRAALRFLREARVTGQLEHPNIVPVYEIGRRAGGELYYTMKLVKGRTLASALRACHSLADRLALLPHFHDLCNAIAYAHNRGVIHRDIKPDNVMVGEFGETVVLDWGVAKVSGSADLPADIPQPSEAVNQTMDGSILGTPAYMSPEQAEGKVDAIDERSDVWGLGVVLFEILTGQTPFPGNSAFEVIGQVLVQPVPEVRTLCPDAPPELIAIVRRALSRRCEERYSDARGMAEEIGAFRSGRRVASYEYSAYELVSRFVEKHRTASLVGAVAVALIMVLTSLAFVQIAHERSLALAQRREAQDFANVMLFDLEGGMAHLSGALPLRRQLLNTALEYYQRNVDPKSGSPAERREMAVAYLKIGDLALSLDRVQEAARAQQMAWRIFNDLAGSGTQMARDDLILSTCRLGAVAAAEGNLDLALDRYQQALNMQQNLPGTDPRTKRDASAIMVNLGLACQRMGKLDDAASWYSKVAAIRQTRLQNAPHDPQAQSDVFELLLYQGMLADAQRHDEVAHQFFSQALQLAQKEIADRPHDLDAQLALAQAQLFDGQSAASAEMLQKLVQQQPDRADLGGTLAEALMAGGHYREAVAAAQAAVKVSETVATRMAIEVDESVAARLSGDVADAEAALRQAIDDAGHLHGRLSWTWYGVRRSLHEPEATALFTALDRLPVEQALPELRRYLTELESH
ncbi:MAG: serine/threonine-protein kinase [Candidatus Xenobia bacterium]